MGGENKNENDGVNDDKSEINVNKSNTNVNSNKKEKDKIITKKLSILKSLKSSYISIINEHDKVK